MSSKNEQNQQRKRKASAAAVPSISVEEVTVENAFEALEFGRQSGDKVIQEKALSVINERPGVATDTDAFLKCGRETLVLFASQEKLAMKESSLFSALWWWAKKRHQRGKKPKRPIRELLGDDLLFRVQFWKMSAHEFVSRCLESHVEPKIAFTDPEALYILKQLSSFYRTESDNCPFPRFNIFRGGTPFTFRFADDPEKQKPTDVQFVVGDWSGQPGIVQRVRVNVRGFRIAVRACLYVERRKTKMEFELCFKGSSSSVARGKHCVVFLQLMVVSTEGEEQTEVVRGRVERSANRFVNGEIRESWGWLGNYQIHDFDPASASDLALKVVAEVVTEDEDWNVHYNSAY